MTFKVNKYTWLWLSIVFQWTFAKKNTSTNHTLRLLSFIPWINFLDVLVVLFFLFLQVVDIVIKILKIKIALTVKANQDSIISIGNLLSLEPRHKEKYYYSVLLVCE